MARPPPARLVTRWASHGDGWGGTIGPEDAVLTVTMWLLAAGFALAALIDARNWRRHRRIRAAGDIWVERLDLYRDFEATQHRGIPVPIGDICRDRQRHR